MDLRIHEPVQEMRGTQGGSDSGGGDPGLVWTEAIEPIAGRALLYLSAGHGLHLRGPVGIGKTTFARTVAARLGREVVSALPGMGADPSAAITVAAASGATLIADADSEGFAQAAPRLAAALAGRMAAHPAFRAIVISRPHSAVPDPLLDRLVTIDCDGYDRDTEVAIVATRSGLAAEEAAPIVDMVRDLRRSREYALVPGLRCSLTLAALAHAAGCTISAGDPRFVAIALDVLGARLRQGPDGVTDPRHRQMLVKLIAHFCPAAAQGDAA